MWEEEKAACRGCGRAQILVMCGAKKVAAAGKLTQREEEKMEAGMERKEDVK